MVDEEGNIYEGTYLNDELHGLCVLYRSSKVFVSFLVADDQKAVFEFDLDTYDDSQTRADG